MKASRSPAPHLLPILTAAARCLCGIGERLPDQGGSDSGLFSPCDRLRRMKKIVAPLMVFLLLSGCSGESRHWYNPGKTRVDFDRDFQECEIIAGELSRKATLTGSREDPQVYARVSDDCLYAKGWGAYPAVQPAPEPAMASQPSPLAVYDHDGSIIQAFGRNFAVPSGFALQSDSVQRFGPTLMENLLLRGPNSVFINFTVQRSLDRKFEPTAYPSQEPFFLYEQGRDGRNSDRLRWTIFAGKIRDEWVTGLGGYLLLGKRERLAIVITQPLPDSQEPVPAGLNLSQGQFQSVERFRDEWLPWLRAQCDR
jgi:hypothetical protein